MNLDETKFFKVIGRIGIWRIIKSGDFLLAFTFSLLFSWISYDLSLSKSMIIDLSAIMVTIASTTLAVIIAGLAIVVSVSDNNFIKLLKQHNIYDNILSLFWFSAIIAGVSIISTIISLSLTKFVNNIPLSKIVIDELIFAASFGISLFFASYALFSVILLVGTIMRWGLYRGAFIDMGYEILEK